MGEPFVTISDVAYIGIDPGTTGAIAVINGDRVQVFPIPMHTVRRNRTDRERLDVGALVDLARAIGATVDGVVTIEDVWIAGGDNPVSAGQLMFISGACETAFRAAGFDVRRVAPQTWKAKFGVAGAGLLETDRSKRRRILKTRARKKAAELFPADATLFARVMDADRAEATLIAKYAQLTDCENRFPLA